MREGCRWSAGADKVAPGPAAVWAAYILYTRALSRGDSMPCSGKCSCKTAVSSHGNPAVLPTYDQQLGREARSTRCRQAPRRA